LARFGSRKFVDTNVGMSGSEVRLGSQSEAFYEVIRFIEDTLFVGKLIALTNKAIGFIRCCATYFIFQKP